jgi:chloride intracellular channel protein 2
MDLYLLAELKTIALKITTVDMLKPPADFRYGTVVEKGQ